MGIMSFNLSLNPLARYHYFHFSDEKSGSYFSEMDSNRCGFFTLYIFLWGRVSNGGIKTHTRKFNHLRKSFLSTEYSHVNSTPIAVQHISRTLSSFKTETLAVLVVAQR